MKEFLLGCNYWSYNAGADMWRDWDEAQIEKDLRLLQENKLTTIRVFPNWRDFQPVIPVYGMAGTLREYRMENEQPPENPYFLSETMLSRFAWFCDKAGQYGIQLIVGLLTGWMSGKLHIPQALHGKNLFTDPLALRFEHYFIKGFVSRFKARPEIYAWDLGNECNCMSSAASSHEAYAWSAAIADAIRVADPSRPVISGMHGLTVENGNWTIRDQAECTDVLTTHPYPYFVPHCSKDPMDSIRTLMHATCETYLYSAIGKKPCLVEELGTLGNNLCADATSADFMRVNLLSNWAHGAEGVLWWCMNEQGHLNNPPYRWSMLERGLGMFDSTQKPKAFLDEMREFANWLETVNITVAAPKTDATVLLSCGQDHWGIAYMAFILAKQAGITVDYAAPNTDLPDSKLYFVPSVHGDAWLYKPYYEQLKQRVRAGATVCISDADGFYTERDEFLGTAVLETEQVSENGTFRLFDAVIPYSRERKQKLAPITATVLAVDSNGDPIVTVNRYGKGTVYFVNFPLEETLLNRSRAFDTDAYKLYEYVVKQTVTAPNVTKDNKMVGITENGNMVTLINYSDQPQKTGLALHNGKQIDRVLRGDPNVLPPCDGAVFTIK
ncbi:MAG: cellulase family glycosylhydrolase [Clostridia bacterium]|nr:cellulase family glycosylhydrolase [Clostridia bacterium]